MSRTFLKKKEDFVCLVCGKRVFGTGYTDHCPQCLFSLHVDVFPGDRKAKCRGLMEPVGVEKKKGEWRILYQCQKCNHQHWNKTAPGDDFEKIVALSKIRQSEEGKTF